MLIGDPLVLNDGSCILFSFNSVHVALILGLNSILYFLHRCKWHLVIYEKVAMLSR